MDGLLIHVAIALFWCARLRENQMLISNQAAHWSLSVLSTLAELVALCHPRVAAMSHLFTMIYLFVWQTSSHQFFWRMSSHHHFSDFCHISACRSNRIYCCSHLLPSFIFHLFVRFFSLAEPCSAEGRHQWHFLQHLKGGLLPSLISWVHIFMLMKAVHDGLEKSDIYRGWLLAGVPARI